MIGMTELKNVFESESNNSDQSTIQVDRKFFFHSMAMALKVKINNVHVGDLKLRGRGNYSVDPGKCVVQVSMAWCKSNKVELHLDPGEKVFLNAGSIFFLLAIPCFIVALNSVFTLKRIGTTRL